MSHLWLAITLIYINGSWYFFGRNVTDKVRNQETLYYAIQITLASALPSKMGNTKIAFFTQVLFSALPEFNQSLLNFFSLFTHNSYTAVW